jgi:protocatechuate 3,4-dioxygenase, alpha subunit
MAPLTPSQTVGPFFHFGLKCTAPEGPPADVAGERIRIAGEVRDGAGAPVADALLEFWQADASGHYAHPDDPGATVPGDFNGFARVATDAEGRFALATIKPGSVPGPDGSPQAPHLLVGVLARGLLQRLVTRIYFDGEPSNETDAILRLVPAARRGTLVARAACDRQYRFDIVLQGSGETVFFDV